MRFIRNIEFRNLFLDVIVSLLAFQFIDITIFVESSLQWIVYFIVIVQSVALFLMWGDETILNDTETPEHFGFLGRFKFNLSVYFRHFAMFSWVFVCIWVMIPIWHLRESTGHDFRWAVRVSVITSIVFGLILMIRFFSTDVEQKQIDAWKIKPDKEKGSIKNFFVLLYEFLIYENIGGVSLRSWLAFIIVFGLLVYTETLFEIITRDGSVSIPCIVAGILFSYLPMRMLILIKTPFSFIELASALIAFGLFIYSLFF